MFSKSRFRRLLPGKRRNKNEGQIHAVPISEAPDLWEEGTDPDMPVHTSQQQEPNLNIDYGRFQEAVPHSVGFGAPLSQQGSHPPSVIAVPASQHSHYGERAITQVDYEGSQAVPSIYPQQPQRPPRSGPRSHPRHGSRHSKPPPSRIWTGICDLAPPTPSLSHLATTKITIATNENTLESQSVIALTAVAKTTTHMTMLLVESGRKKAVCIGINYTGQSSQLDGCVNDAKSMYRFLIDRQGFRARDIIRLTDEARDPRNLPTRANILGAMRWLVRGARKHDSLFFHYSGHGAQVRDRNGDEVDGYDEVIFPVDYSKTGTIIDDELHDQLIKPLPAGCRLTAVFDSCHSGSVLDVPYLYHSDGRVKKSDVTRKFIKEKASPAEVLCWSGSVDSGSAADAHAGGIAVGAMSYAFLKALRDNNSRLTYDDLLKDLRRATRKYHQKPQLSASHRIDLNRRFMI
ncbi:caspase domain-containing protein [Gloeopeniophorella convolvens]|nr:caspase domain-containing protein [Gloeopeniophorella convolvens]